MLFYQEVPKPPKQPQEQVPIIQEGRNITIVGHDTNVPIGELFRRNTVDVNLGRPYNSEFTRRIEGKSGEAWSIQFNEPYKHNPNGKFNDSATRGTIVVHRTDKGGWLVGFSYKGPIGDTEVAENSGIEFKKGKDGKYTLGPTQEMFDWGREVGATPLKLNEADRTKLLELNTNIKDLQIQYGQEKSSDKKQEILNKIQQAGEQQTGIMLKYNNPKIRALLALHNDLARNPNLDPAQLELAMVIGKTIQYFQETQAQRLKSKP